MAIETSRGLLVAALRGSGRNVYAINPMAVARYRDRHSMARKKSDHVDAMTLANILRTDAHAHRTLPADSDLARAITVFARCPGRDLAAHRGNPRTACTPARVLPGFSQRIRRHRSHEPRHGGRTRDTRDRTDACAGCAIDQGPHRYRIAACGRQRRLEDTATRIQNALGAPQLRQPPLVEQAMGCQAGALLATLNTECVNADKLNESAAEAFRNHPDYAVITSFPGLGEATGARVLAEIGDDRGRFADARRLKSFAGAAPVTRASGRTISITHRHVKNNRLAAVGFVWAFAAIPRPGPIKDHYNRRRTHGDRHAAALRNVFNRLLGQLYHCLHTGHTYDASKAFPGSVHDAEPAAA